MRSVTPSAQILRTPPSSRGAPFSHHNDERQQPLTFTTSAARSTMMNKDDKDENEDGDEDDWDEFEQNVIAALLGFGVGMVIVMFHVVFFW